MRRWLLAVVLCLLPGLALAQMGSNPGQGPAIPLSRLKPIPNNTVVGNGTGVTAAPSAMVVGGGLSTAGNVLSVLGSVPNIKCDGVTDDGPAINAAIQAGQKFISLPGNAACYTRETIQFPPLLNFFRFGGQPGNQTLLLTDQNIPLIAVGTYAYTGVNDWSFATDPVYSSTVDDLVLINTAVTKTNTVGIALNGLQNGFVFNINCQGIANCVKVNPISAWNFVNNISANGGSVQNAILVNGAGFNANLYNSTGNIYTDIQGQSVGQAIIQYSGCTFGDSVVQGVIGTGIVSGGSGAGGGAVAGVWLNSTGANCTDNVGFYAHNITIAGVDMDGVADYVVRGTFVSGIAVGTYAQGGNVTNAVSFDANSGGNMILGTLSSFVGTFTHTLQNETNATQALTGFGFRPSKCHFSGSVNFTSVGSYATLGGDSDRNRQQVATFFNAGTVATQANIVLNFIDVTGTKNDFAAVTAYGPDGLTLTWNGTGGPSGTATNSVSCQQ